MGYRRSIPELSTGAIAQRSTLEQVRAGSLAAEVFAVASGRPRTILQLLPYAVLATTLVSLGPVAAVMGLKAEHPRALAEPALALEIIEIEPEPAPEPEPEPESEPEPEPELAPEPEPEPEPEPVPRVVKPASKPEPAERPVSKKAEPKPASAGEVLASAKEAEVVDFTGFGIVQGKGRHYVGGVTTQGGTNTKAVPAVRASPRPQAKQKTTRRRKRDRSRPVRLPARNWDCDWPREARSLGIARQVVVLRAVVNKNGRVSKASIVADPGHGFGRAALKCAKAARFEPALDRDGRSYAATSPPIRVEFTR